MQITENHLLNKSEHEVAVYGNKRTKNFKSHGKYKVLWHSDHAQISRWGTNLYDVTNSSYILKVALGTKFYGTLERGWHRKRTSRWQNLYVIKMANLELLVASGNNGGELLNSLISYLSLIKKINTHLKLYPLPGCSTSGAILEGKDKLKS